MTRKNVFLSIAFFGLIFNASAATVTLQDAQTVALNFFKITTGYNNPRNPLAATLQYTRTESDNTIDFYVFNIAPVKGFVIVSATDNDDPIIGYSTESVFRNDFSEVGVNDWLTRWSEELHYVNLNNITASPTAAAKWTAYRQGYAPASLRATSVGPLLQTTWDQNNELSLTPALYNNYCPGTGQNQAVTGCVATAMAQIMKYWNYPTTGTGSYEYDDEQSLGYSESYGVLSFNFGATTFNWADMPDSLTNSSSTAQIDAIGTLMSAAGISVEMDYAPDGSGAQVLQSEAGGADSACAQYSYVHYFGYQNIIEGLLVSTGGGGHHGGGGITSAQLTDSIMAELNAGRVVEVQGTDPHEGGHTWVCDGYNASDMLHMNWGWSGDDDGYFALTNLDPGSGTPDAFDFSEDIGALTHIQPPNGVVTTIGESATAGASAICYGGNTTLTATTHTGATYSWSPTAGLSCATCATTNVTATETTTYIVTADSAGFTATASVTVNVNSAIVPGTPAVTEVACYGQSNGVINMNGVSGGAGDYTYKWSNAATTQTISNLAANTYRVTITDAKACTATAAETITQPFALAETLSQDNAACGLSNGSVTITVSGGTAGYIYKWNSGQTAASISNLAAGSYDVTVKDANGCSLSASADISSSGSLDVTATGVNVKCNGSNSGSVSVSPSGGSGYTYSWSNGATTQNISGLNAGTYKVTVTSSSGCSATTAQTISQPALPLSLTLTPANEACGLPNGSVSTLVQGGTAGYTYVWNNGATTSSVSNLNAGNYQVTVEDANSCTITEAVTISAVAGLTLTINSTNVSCFGNANGVASAVIANGGGPYTYTWSTGAGGDTISNLLSGAYTVTVKDNGGCSSTASVNITQPSAIDVSTSVTDCTDGDNNGTAAVSSVTGGAGGYTYVWNDGQTTQSISNLSAGTYHVTVADQSSCQVEAAVIVGTATGINSVNGVTAFTMYPNPATSDVLVSVSNLSPETTLTLTNILGQQLVTTPVTDNQMHLNVANFAGGVYFIRLQQGEKQVVKQLIIAR